MPTSLDEMVDNVNLQTLHYPSLAADNLCIIADSLSAVGVHGRCYTATICFKEFMSMVRLQKFIDKSGDRTLKLANPHQIRLSLKVTTQA